MKTLWGLTEAQFLVLYTSVVLVAVASRVVVTGGTIADRRRDGPTVFFLIVMAIGLVRLIADLLVRGSPGVLLPAFVLSVLLWLVAHRNGYFVVLRKAFWLFWGIAVMVVGSGLLDLGRMSGPKSYDFLILILVMMAIVLFSMRDKSRGGGGGGGGCGGGCGGG